LAHRPLVDGTIIWTSPTGQTYLTRPGSRLLFPALCLPTGEIPTAPTVDRPPGDCGIMMPTRRRTRAQDRTHRINQERRQRTELIAEEEPTPSLARRQLPTTTVLTRGYGVDHRQI
jgi:hypothetical protein